MFGPAGHFTNCQLYWTNKANYNWCILLSYVILSYWTFWLSPATQVHFWINDQVLLPTHWKQGWWYQPECFTPPGSMLHRVPLPAQDRPCYTLLYYVILQTEFLAFSCHPCSFQNNLVAVDQLQTHTHKTLFRSGLMAGYPKKSAESNFAHSTFTLKILIKIILDWLLFT